MDSPHPRSWPRRPSRSSNSKNNLVTGPDPMVFVPFRLGDLDAELFGQLPSGGLLVCLPGCDHTADAYVINAGIDILGVGAPSRTISTPALVRGELILAA